MKAEYYYTIKLEYQPGVSDPSKTFIAYSEIINSFRRIDNLLGRSLSHDSLCIQTLENIEIGSLTTKIKSLFEYPDDELTSEPEYSETDIENYCKSSTSIIFNAMTTGKIDSERQIENIQNNIDSAARTHNIDKSFTYSKPSTSEIVEVLSDISESINMLSENDVISYLNNDLEIPMPRSINVNVEKIENDMKKKIVTGKRELILKIKKVYLLGNAKWEFKHGKNSIDAKIMDAEWLEKFHTKAVTIAPGDSLEVVVDIVEEYDKYGNLLSADYSIAKVLSIIPGEIDDED